MHILDIIMSTHISSFFNVQNAYINNITLVY